jgi:hypothetical protein
VSDDRPKLTYSERDKLRREGGQGGGPPRSQRAQQEQANATRSALEQAGSLFSPGKGGAEGAQLETAIRDSHGTPAFVAACQAYLDQVGVPDDPSLLTLFLDSGDRGLLVPALEKLLELKNAASLQVGAGLRNQLRVLEQDRDDTVAGISEELLED